MFHTHSHTHTFANPAHTYGPSQRGSADSLSQRRSLCSSRLPLPSVLLSGTPICEHIITDVQEERGRDARVTGSLSLSRGSKDEVKRTRVLLVDEENARVSERLCKGV